MQPDRSPDARPRDAHRPRPSRPLPHRRPGTADPVTIAAPVGSTRGLVTRRRVSVAAIASGVALLAGAASGLPGAGAAAHLPPPPPAAAAQPGRALGVLDLTSRNAARNAARPPAAAPVPAQHGNRPARSHTPAPATPAVISGLAANGIPNVALNAYRVAAARIDSVDPGCGIDWALLAGIGREESDHGQFAGAVLHADGTSTPQIVGPALDGVHWDYIPAPGNGLALDGDATYAHALGPMQFIPSTWAIYGADANGDGTADVFNINDAALGAARYLCAAGGDLRTHAGQVAAVLAYNHSDTYLAQVLALANAYRTGIPVTGIPQGITSGPLPRISNTGYVPPVDPADPTATGGGHRHGHRPAGSRHGRHGHHGAGGGTGGGRTRHRPGHSGSPSPSGSMHRSSSAPAPHPSPTHSRHPRRSPSPTPTSPQPSISLPSLPLPSPTCVISNPLGGGCLSL